MKWHFVRTPNGMLITIQAEPSDDTGQVEILREARKGLADEAGIIEGLKDEISFFRPLKWPTGKTPVRTS